MIDFTYIYGAYSTTNQDFYLFLMNIILLVFAKKFVKIFEHTDIEIKKKVFLFRSFNMLFLVLHIFDIFIRNAFPDYEAPLLKVAISAGIIYASYFVAIFFEYWNKKKFGSTKVIDEEEKPVATYASRMTNFVIDIVVVFVTFIILVNYWGYSNLLGATQIFGVMIAIVLYSAPAWFHNLINGLMLLSGKMFEEGDIIDVDGIKYIIFRFGHSRINLLNIQKNSRTTFLNAIFSEKKINNITKMASKKGFRDCIDYDIGYAVDLSKPEEERIAQHDEYKETLQKMFSYAYEKCLENEEIELHEGMSGFEVHLIETGNYALKYRVSFHVKKPDATNTTSKARRYLNTKFHINQEMLDSSVRSGIDLSTATLIKIV